MSRDVGGSPRPSGLSRRRLLAGLGGIGAVGMASGLGTGAYLADRETFSSNTFGAGTVELLVNGAPADGTVAVDVSGIDRGDSGRERFDVGARTNPVRLWIASECVPNDALSRALEVDLRADDASLTGGYRPLAEVRRDLLNGERIDDGCLAPEDTVAIDVYWRLPADARDSLANDSTSLAFLLYAEQCRHVDEPNAAGSNPFAGRVCEEAECVPCEDENGVKIGALTLRYLGDERIDLTVAAVGGGAGGRGTGGTEIFAAPVEPNEEFVLDGANASTNDDRGWIGPNVYLDDGTDEGDRGADGVTIHTSCSVPLGPGDVYGDFEVVAVTTTDGESVCGSGDGGDTPVDEPDPDVECGVCADGQGSLATLDVRYRGGDDASISVVSTKGNTSGELFAGTVADGDVFTLDGSDVERPGSGTARLGPEIEIAVTGGATTPVHVSCSVPLAVDMRFGDADEFEIVAGTLTTGEPLCGSEEN